MLEFLLDRVRVRIIPLRGRTEEVQLGLPHKAVRAMIKKHNSCSRCCGLAEVNTPVGTSTFVGGGMRRGGVKVREAYV